MPRYTYIALNARGQESTGLVEANSTNDAIGQLRQAGYFPTSVYEEGQGGGGAVAKKSGPAANAATVPVAGKKKSKGLVLWEKRKP